MKYELTSKQIRTLDRIEKQDPEALVVGWDEVYNGPRVHPSQGPNFTVSPQGTRTNRPPRLKQH